MKVLIWHSKVYVVLIASFLKRKWFITFWIHWDEKLASSSVAHMEGTYWLMDPNWCHDVTLRSEWYILLYITLVQYTRRRIKVGDKNMEYYNELTKWSKMVRLRVSWLSEYSNLNDCSFVLVKVRTVVYLLYCFASLGFKKLSTIIRSPSFIKPEILSSSLR